MKSSLRPIAVVLALAFAGAASAAETQYLFVKGQRSGMIKGSVVAKGQEGAILVDSISHEIVSPRDAASGMATGRRQHKPFTVLVHVDKAWALLYNSMVVNENLPQVELRVVAPAASGLPAVQRRVVLTNASISDIKEYTVDNAKGNGKYDALEISFTYQKIEWTWTDGGLTAMDDWQSTAQ